jgi:hypothetical protein
MKHIYLATVRIAIDADAAHIGSVDEAQDWFSGLLSNNSHVFDWCYGARDNCYHKPPELIEINDKAYDEGELWGPGINKNEPGRLGILAELKKVKKCKYNMLPVLMAELTHEEAKASLEHRLKKGK